MSLVALLKALRPLQWVKNGLVFLPCVFAVDIAWSTDDLDPVPELLLKLVIVALAFCALSSALLIQGWSIDSPSFNPNFFIIVSIDSDPNILIKSSSKLM